ncbi:hypothetical protein SK128_025072, partial [Halocaridina rubra]
GYNDKVFGVRFSPVTNNRLVTFGAKHIKFWNQTGGGLTFRQVSMGFKFKQDTVLCSSVGGDMEAGNEWWVFGLSSGNVLYVKNSKLERNVKIHKGPIYAILVTTEDGHDKGRVYQRASAGWKLWEHGETDETDMVWICAEEG